MTCDAHTALSMLSSGKTTRSESMSVLPFQSTEYALSHQTRSACDPYAGSRSGQFYINSGQFKLTNARQFHQFLNR